MIRFLVGAGKESDYMAVSPNKKKKNASPKIKRKLVLLLIFAGILLLVLALRLTQVMLINAPELQEKATSQWTRRSSLAAQRGRIMDRNGLVLAQTGTAYRVLLNPPSIAADDRVRIASEISEVLGMDYEYVLSKVSTTERVRDDGSVAEVKQVQLKRQVEASVIDQLEALQLGKGVSYITDQKRYYPFGQLFAQVIGFSGTDGEGQTGIEAEYDSYLAGTPGKLIAEVDRKGNALSYGEEQFLAPTDGYDISLTVDSVAQSYLEKYIEECQSINGSITTTGILLNPNTGEILASSTYPSFDLNEPPRYDVTSLMSMSRNRSVTDTFEAGSLFKIITLSAAIDSGAVSMDSKFECSGSKTFRLEKIRCWKTNGHGDQTLTQAVENSCNCAFMEMGLNMGVNTFYDYIYAFGFDKSTDCGLPQEDSGEVTHRKYIREPELARTSFGLSITCTPIQLINAVAAAVNGGILYQPYIIDRVSDKDNNTIIDNEPIQIRRVIKSSTSTLVRQILESVVDNGGGSNAQVPNYRVGGKMGTSLKYEEDGSPSRTRFIASFVGFLPASNPQLICLVTCDEPGVPVMYGTTVAAPWVQKTLADLVQYYGLQPDKTTETMEVPNVVGMSGEDAARRVGYNFTTNMTEAEMTGVVTRQIPAAGTQAPKGSLVVLYTTMTTFNDEGVASDQVKVPNLIGLRRLNAYDLLAKAGLKLSMDLNYCTGLIDSQSIPADTLVDPGTEVFVTFYDETRKTPEPTENTTGEENNSTGATPDPNAPQNTPTPGEEHNG